jgi:hypothetical protein
MAAADRPEPEVATQTPSDLVSLMLAATPAARSCCDAGAEPSLAPASAHQPQYAASPPPSGDA